MSEAEVPGGPPDRPEPGVTEPDPGGAHPDWWGGGGDDAGQRWSPAGIRPSREGPTAAAAGVPGAAGRGRPLASPASGAGWPLLVMVAAALMITGSLTAWLTTAGQAVTGVSLGDAGWISLIAGIVAAAGGVGLVLSGQILTPGRRLLGQLAGAAAGAGFGISLFTVVNLPSHTSAGWGLVMVLVASAVTLVGSIGFGAADA